MDEKQIRQIIEGAILAAGEALNLDRLLLLFDEAERPEREGLKEQIVALQEEYADRGIELKEVASGYRFQVRKELGPWVSRLWAEKPARYSRALLETLSLIAYRQPITRSEIEEIRGVSVSSHIVKALLEREWVRVVGHRDVPGRPALFATTKIFLDYFDLKSLEELPSLAELRDLDKINEELDLVESGASPDDAADSSGENQNAADGDASENGADGENKTAAHQYLLGEEEDDEELEGAMDMDEVDKVLASVEDSFRRKPDEELELIQAANAAREEKSDESEKNDSDSETDTDVAEEDDQEISGIADDVGEGLASEQGETEQSASENIDTELSTDVVGADNIDVVDSSESIPGPEESDSNAETEPEPNNEPAELSERD